MNPLWLNPNHQYEYKITMPTMPGAIDIPYIGADASRVYVKFNFAFDYSTFATAQYVSVHPIRGSNPGMAQFINPFMPYAEFDIWRHGYLVKEAWGLITIIGSVLSHAVLEICDRGPLAGL